MMQNLGRFVASSYIAPAQPLSVVSGVGFEYIRIINNSPYNLMVNLNGQGTINFPEFYLEDIYLTNSYLGSITIVPSTNISSSRQAVSNTITINVYNKNEISSPQSQPLAQPAVNPTASGNPIFTAGFGVGSSAGNNQSVNVFNPANSGVVGVFHNAKAFTNSVGVPTVNLIYLAGADLNFGTAVPIVSHTGIPAPNTPVSIMHATWDDSNSAFGGSAVDVSRLPGKTTNGTVDVLTFPDVFYLYPGGNVRLSVADTTTGNVIENLLKWTELVVTPQLLLVQGASGVANVLDQEQGVVGATFIKSVIPGTGTIINITDDGVGVYNVDQSGTLHQVFKFNSSGNPLQLGQSGDTTEVLGSLTADVALSSLGSNSLGATTVNGLLTAAAGIVVNGSSSPAIDISGDSGAIGLKLKVGTYTRQSTVGDTTIAHAGTAVNHGLGVIPTFVLYSLDAGAAPSDLIAINFGTMTTSQFTAYSSNAVSTGNVRFFVYGA